MNAARPLHAVVAAVFVALPCACGWPAPPADAAAAVQRPDTSLVVRRIAQTAPYAVFPDGGRLVVVDTVGNLLVENVATREQIPLTTDGSWMESRWPETAAVSPDSRAVAIGWHDEGTLEVRVVGSDGTGSRSIMRRDAREGSLSVADWAPDARSILVVREDENGRQELLRVDPASGNSTVVHDLGWQRPDLPRYSPDGRLVALTLQTTDETSSRDLYVLDPARGELTQVADLQESIMLGDWAPDGEAIYFATSNEGVATLWRQRVAGGAAAGEPERIRGDLARFRPVEYAGRGLYFNAHLRDIGIAHAQLAESAAAIAAPPARIVDVLYNYPSALAWSPDAQHVAYMLTGPYQERQIVIRSRATGEERVFAPAASLANGLEWRHDGLHLMGTAEGRSRLYRLDFNAGRLVEVEDLEGMGATQLPRLSADGSARMSVRGGATPTAPRRLVVEDTRTGAERVLLEARAIGTVRISPDGRHVAMIEPDGQTRLLLLDVATGESRVIYRTAGESWIKGGSLGWTPDSDAVIVLEQHVTDGAASSRFRRVALDGSMTEILNAGGPGGAVAFALSHDGRHLAYTTVPDPEPRSEGWVIEGLERF